ncbi:hypothetical protein N7447_011113 [Penicillium robsamsonii]|uniref:uncharacterized protein n=1 Tax=Penicillium robsamsonii TaxID=1792511 RepID=UPI002546E3E3|nr:uncharacterized protein N7447_011113 [Penicillium robsamsonii]KAJ5807657.1 hypothetical protein N7447_011113 [Penicillium robsamsonii]
MQFVRKAEEALTGKKDESHESTKSSNHGPHKSNLANKLDPRVDSDKDNRAAHTHATGAGLGSTHGTTGTHSSTLGSGTTHGTSGVTGTGAGLGSTHGTTGSTNAGPHNSNIANKVDPRVDSDRDNRARHEGLAGTGTTHGTSGVTGTGAGLGSTHGTTGTHSSALGSGTTHGTTSSTNTGPHGSSIANKIDPRVDSDRDNRAHHDDLTGAGLGSTHGTAGTHSSTLGSGTTHGTSDVTGTGAGLGSTHGTTGSTNAGPHSSNIANKVDPRVDSDRDNRAHHGGLSGAGAGAGAGLGSTHHTTATGTHGSALGSGTGATHNTIREQPVYTTGGPIATPGSSSTNAGPHSSNIANKLDPRVDSDRDSSAQHQSTIAGTGAGTTTHGTHTRGATGIPTSSALGGSGLDTAGRQNAVAGSSYNTPATGTTGTTGTTAPHGSSIANKLDPRVDSEVTRAENEGLHRQI